MFIYGGLIMLKGRDLLSIHDLSVEEIEEILALAQELKAKQRGGTGYKLLKGKTLGLLVAMDNSKAEKLYQRMGFVYADMKMLAGAPYKHLIYQS